MGNLFSLSPNYSAATEFCRDLLYAVVMIIITTQRAAAQISPGDLSSSHTQLEGMSNCTQCHTLGKTILSERCLACHTEIRSRLDTKIGLHGRNKYEQCIDCHKEHHGRDFAMRKIDTKSFDHSLTGYLLKGKHINLDCSKCHEEAKIRKSDIGQKTKEFKAHTYLGLLPDCSACHRDIHAGQLSPRCEQCHTLDGWKPAANFSHANAAYKLTGKHETVECVGCHKKKLEKETVVQYVHLEFAACSSCHSDPHKGKFNQACQSCHITSGWNEGQAKNFDHSLTRYPLRGKHISVKCEQCHTEAAKKGKNAIGAFAIARFTSCFDCHADAHANQFVQRRDQGKCESCHTEEAFMPSIYSVADHKKSRFELIGAHVATACTACHVSGAVQAKSTRLFKWKEGLQCLTCHKDVHSGQFQSNPKKNCESCHNAIAWNSLLFSHEATKFPLLGKHAEISCLKCHTKRDVGLATERVQYRSLSVQCISCHRDEHEGQFVNAGSTDCARCHTAASWKIADFNHTLLTRYELTGKHAAVSCGKCHTQTTMNGRTIARYKPLGTTCVDCHSTTDGNEKK
jgi:nitrate/TMAO reductase-like tetraheme cytochrome c subunit